MVIEAALNRLFTANHFDVYSVWAMQAVVGTPRGATDAETMLHALHCVKYADMRPGLRESLPRLVTAALAGELESRPAVAEVLSRLGA